MDVYEKDRMASYVNELTAGDGSEHPEYSQNRFPAYLDAVGPTEEEIPVAAAEESGEPDGDQDGGDGDLPRAA